MARTAFLTTVVLMVALTLALLRACEFLVPYRQLIWREYARAMAVFAILVAANVFAAVYWTCRRLFLADTGRKLAHLEKQLRTGGSLSEELAERLKE